MGKGNFALICELELKAVWKHLEKWQVMKFAPILSEHKVEMRLSRGNVPHLHSNASKCTQMRWGISF